MPNFPLAVLHHLVLLRHRSRLITLTSSRAPFDQYTTHDHIITLPPLLSSRRMSFPATQQHLHAWKFRWVIVSLQETRADRFHMCASLWLKCMRAVVKRIICVFCDQPTGVINILEGTDRCRWFTVSTCVISRGYICTSARHFQYFHTELFFSLSHTTSGQRLNTAQRLVRGVAALLSASVAQIVCKHSQNNFLCFWCRRIQQELASCSLFPR